jgi:HEAT repeat protein/Uri superfamily endonuclease
MSRKPGIIGGTYVIALWLGSPRRVRVGRLGEFLLPAGWYLYVGSARGPGGLAARLGRHWRKAGDGKRLHWHVDHVRQLAAWAGAWANSSGQKLECDWAARLSALEGAGVVAAGLGASDCKCAAHLLHLPALPAGEWFGSELQAERIDVEQRELDELLEALAGGDEASREAAVHALARFGSRAAGPLVAILGDGDGDCRWWATRALAEIGGREAVTALSDVLEDPDPDLRACAALALGRIGDDSAAPALAMHLADSSAFVASIAADALSLIGEGAIETLAASLNSPEPHTRLLAVRALSRIKSQEAIGPLFGVLEDPSYLVRYYAHEALEAFGVGMVLFSP